MMNVKGVDVSVWQGGNVDYNALKKQGCNFVIIRAGYGNAIVYPKQYDEYFNINYNNAKAAGLNVGAYWYCYATDKNAAVQEANSFIKAIQGKTFEFPVYYDIEEKNTFNKGKAVCDEIATAFCDTMEKAGYFTGIYCSTYWYTNYFSESVRNRYATWIAEYSSKCNYKGQYGIWQYGTENCTSVAGGKIDANECYVDYPSIIKSGGYNGYKKANVNKAELLQKVAALSADVDDLKRLIEKL